MRDDELDAMEYGEACDMAVASAIGVAHERRIVDWGMSGPKYSGCLVTEGAYGEFRPSTDWNDAMFAVQRAGHGELTLEFPERSQSRKWEAGFYEGEHYDLAFVAHGVADTGPLAICMAILKLARKAQ